MAENVEQMPLTDLMRNFRDGEEHGWQTEFDWLDTHHAHRMDMLTTSVQEVGIQRPILLGDDGRVWDGHHRIAAAHRLGIETVPVVRSSPVQQPSTAAQVRAGESEGVDRG